MKSTIPILSVILSFLFAAACPAAIEVSTASIEAILMNYEPEQTFTVKVTDTSAEGVTPWTASFPADVDWAAVSPAAGTGTGELTVTVKVQDRLRLAFLRVAGGGSSRDITVTVRSIVPAFQSMVAHPVHPVLAAIHEGSLPALLFHDSATMAIRARFPILNPSFSGARLLVNQFDGKFYFMENAEGSTTNTRWLRTFDPVSLQETARLIGGTGQFLVPGTPVSADRMAFFQSGTLGIHGLSEGLPLQTNAVLTESPAFHVWDQRRGLSYTLRWWENGIDYTRFRHTGALLEAIEGSGRMAETPVPSRVVPVASEDVSHLYLGRFRFKVTDTALLPDGLAPEPVLAASAAGAVLSTAAGAWNGSTGEKLRTYTAAAPVQAIAGDWLYLHAPGSGPYRLSLNDILPRLIQASDPVPADGAAVLASTPLLQWATQKAAAEYRIYFGTDAAAVAAAGPASPLLRGTVTAAQASMPALQPAMHYHWRVDAVDAAGAVAAGRVWTFSTATLLASPGASSLKLLAGSADTGLTITLDAAAPLAWAASEASGWLNIVNPSGTTPGPLSITVSPGGLTAGIHHAAITFTVDGRELTYPVNLEIVAPSPGPLVSDPVRADRLYSVHTPSEAAAASELLVIDAASANIQRAIPAGHRIFAFSAAPEGGAVYTLGQNTASGGSWHISRFNPETGEMTGREWTGIQTGGGPFSIAAGRQGTLYIAASRTLHTLAFDSGAVLLPPVSAPELESIALSPDGTRICAIATNGIGVLNITPSGIVRADSAGRSLNSPGPILFTRDGGRVFAGRYLNDLSSLLQPRAVFPASLQAVTGGGEVYFTVDGAFRTQTRKRLFTLPHSAAVAAVNADDSRFVWFAHDAVPPRFLSLPVSGIADIPGPNPADGAVLDALPGAFSASAVPQATAYDFYFGADAAAVGLAGRSSPEFVSTAAAPLFSPPAAGVRAPACRYWRIDTVTAEGTVKGAVWQIFLRAPEVGSHRTDSSQMVMQQQQLSVAGDGNDAVWAVSAWEMNLPAGTTRGGLVFLTRIPGSHTWRTVQRLPVTGSGNPAVTTVAIGEGRIAAGSIPDRAVMLYTRHPVTGLWQQERRLTGPATGENFGASVAISGSQLAVGAPLADRTGAPDAGAVDIHDIRTGVRSVRLQASSALAGAQVGRSVRLSGDWLAAIGAEGTVFLWRRSATGTWSFFTTIGFSGSVRSIALDGTLLAISRTPSGTFNSLLDIYRFGTAWTRVHTVEHPGSAAGADFGAAVGLSGGMLTIGEPGYTDAFTGEFTHGRTHLLRRAGSDTVWHALAPITYRQDVLASTVSDYSRIFGVGGPYLMAAQSEPAPGEEVQFKTVLIDAERPWPPQFSTAPALVTAAGSRWEYHGAALPGSPTSPVQFSLAAGPAWMSVVPDGENRFLLSGTPPAGTVSTIKVEVAAVAADGQRSVQVIPLLVVAPAALPVISALSGPDSGRLSDGSPLELSVAAGGGTVALAYQWYFNGVPIPGATGAAFSIPAARTADSGSYHVRVSSGSAFVDSSPVVITVTADFDRHAGEWDTAGRTASRTGYVPARFGRHIWQLRWEAPLTGFASGAAISTNRVFFSTSGQPSSSLIALDLRTGAPVWNLAAPADAAFGPVTLHRGRLYLQRNHFETAGLTCVNAATGAAIWSSSLQIRSGYLHAPAVTDAGIWVSGGEFDGLYQYELGGQRRWLAASPSMLPVQTPAVEEDSILALRSGVLGSYAPADGADLFSAPVLAGHEGSVSVREGIAVVCGSAGVQAIRVTDGRLLWERRPGGAGLVAMHARSAGTVFAAQSREVVEFAESDGTPGRRFVTGIQDGSQEAIVAPPIVTEDTLIVCSGIRTFIFSLADGAMIQELPRGGFPACAGGWLILSGTGGVAAWQLNQQPQFARQQEELVIDEDTPLVRSTAASDPDGDAISYSAPGLPAWLTLAPDGTLSGTPGNDDTGVIDFLLSASDGAVPEPAVQSVRIRVNPVNDPPEFLQDTLQVSAPEDSMPEAVQIGASLLRDVDDPPEAVTLTIVANSAPGIVSAVLTGRSLRLTPAPDAAGMALITLRATDAAGLQDELVCTVVISPVPDAPRVLPLPPVDAGPAALPVQLRAAAGFTDPDEGEVLRYSLGGSTNPALFSSLSVDPVSGVLQGEIAPYQSGTAAVSVSATGLDGLTATVTVTVSVPPLPVPGITGLTSVLSRQTGLLEWKVRITNTAVRAIGGFELDLPPLPAGALLYNASGTRPGGTPFIRYGLPVQAGESVTLVLEFYHPARNFAGLPPAATASPVLPQPATQAGNAAGSFAIDRVVSLPQALLLEFPSVPGSAYQIEYAGPDGLWKISPVRVRAAGTRLQWLDRGAPWTDSPPAAQTSRFYRVRQAGS